MSDPCRLTECADVFALLAISVLALAFAALIVVEIWREFRR